MKITKKQIKELAETPSLTVKVKLEEWYPEAFEEGKYFSKKELELMLTGDVKIQIRSCSNYNSKAFYLSDNYNWKLVTDEDGQLCLLPTKK